MKTVFLKPRLRGLTIHSLNNELIDNPPQDYKIITEQSFRKGSINKIRASSKNYLLKKVLHYTGGLPYVIVQSTLPLKGYEKYDLIFASQHALTSKKPWVVDCEFFDALTSYFDITLSKKIIEKKLKAKSCKAILPHSEWGKNTILNSINCDGLTDKIKVVRYSSIPKKIMQKKNNEICRLLFVGSSNPANIDAFEQKGLFEIVDAFMELEKKYDKIELVVRSWVSQEIIEKTKKSQNIKILKEPVSSNELEKLYLSSDIFPHTGFEGTNKSILDAMSYGLPVILSSMCGNPELIDNMKNGIIIDPPNSQKLYNKRGVPISYSNEFNTFMRKTRPFMTKKIKENLELLIEDFSLRQKISKEAKLTIEKGEFSLEHKNKLLKEIFDEATS
jgi:glycosyltransferase involved in cell wall biosynthesis